jgi:PAS domain S-box-containing protein
LIFGEGDGVQIVNCVAALAGVGGILAVLAAKPKRLSPAGLGLMAAFAALLLGGAMGVKGTMLTNRELGEQLLFGGALGMVPGLVLTTLEGRSRERARQTAVVEWESSKREVERLGGTNVRLEDELRETRRKLAAAEKTPTQTNPGLSAAEAGALRQRKALEAALASERKHRAVFEGANEGMAMLERETLRMSAVNASLVRMTGWEAADLAQKNIVEIFAAGSHQPGKADLQRAAREGRPLAVELTRKDGGVAYADVSVTVIGAGAEAQLLTIVRDMSERRLLEQELQLHLAAVKERERRLEDANRELGDRSARIEEMNVRLQQLQEAKDQFVSTVSHELRTPLTSIRSFSEILLKHGDSEPAVRREFIEIINKESERLTRLVNNLLDLAKIEAGGSRLEVAEFDVREVVADAAASMSGMATERRVTLRRECGSSPRLITGDRDKIQQLATNLLGNALKFSPEDGEVLLEVKDGPTPGRTEIAVVDHGPGIPAGELESVFEKFRRGVDAPRAVPGTGLGLAICREIAKLHCGRIWAESTLGKGARFRVELPGAEESRILMARAKAGPAAAPEVTPWKPALSAVVPEEDSWSTTGTLPPLRILTSGRVKEDTTSSFSGGLPPIR